MASRIALSADHGAKVPAPPKGWRPRALKIKEKLEIVIRQEGKDPSGDRLAPLEGVEFDHEPPIHLRAWDADQQDTNPPSCSLDHITARNRARHRTKTAKKDVPAIAKTRRHENGGRKRRGPPIPGSKASGWKRPMNGKAERR